MTQLPLPVPEIMDENEPSYCILRSYPGAEEGVAVQIRGLSAKEVCLVSIQPFSVGTMLIADFYDRQDRSICSRKVRITQASYQPGFTIFLKAEVHQTRQPGCALS